MKMTIDVTKEQNLRLRHVFAASVPLSEEELRPILTYAQFLIDGRIVATDGFLLHSTTVDPELMAEWSTQARQFQRISQRGEYYFLARPAIKVVASATTIALEVCEHDFDFPDWQPIVCEANKARSVYRVNPALLMNALKHMTKHNTVFLSLDDNDVSMSIVGVDNDVPTHAIVMGIIGPGWCAWTPRWVEQEPMRYYFTDDSDRFLCRIDGAKLPANEALPKLERLTPKYDDDLGTIEEFNEFDEWHSQ